MIGHTGRMGETPEGTERPGGRTKAVAAALVAALVVAVMLVATLTRGGDAGPAEETAGAGDAEEIEAPSTPTPTAGATWAGPTPPPADRALFAGRDDAPVTLVEFGDFQCPKCGTFARTTKPELMRRYVDTGVVRLVWRDYPTFGEESRRAAVAARAAARQGRFWPFHDALYARQPRRMNSGAINDGMLRDVARAVGLDVARFDADRRDPAVRGAVDADLTFGARLGVPGTPAFLVNGTPFFGAQPIEEFAKAIERARAGK